MTQTPAPTDPPPPHPTAPPPPRAFTQGVGTTFQFIGVTLFLAMMFVCCSSSLLSRETASRTRLTEIGWRLGAAGDRPVYSAQLATTLTVTLGVFFGIALAGLGLGLQAQNRRTPAMAVALTGFATVFWIVQVVFFATTMRSVLMTTVALGLGALFAILFGLSVGAAREMRREPPPPDLATLPKDYQVPYSHMHKDPPEVRLAAELDERRRKLEVQQKELEMLEARLKRRLQHKDE